MSESDELAQAVRRAQAAVAAADPLAVALAGGDLRLPEPGEDAEAAAMRELGAAARAVEALAPRAGDDERDRLCLLIGLRRALEGARSAEPGGPLVLERHLQLRLLRLLDRPVEGLELLAGLVEAGPSLLRRARRAPGPGSAAAGHLALASARRLPAILYACAGVARDAPTAIRTRLEAGLGALLQAGAEESGWLLKEYLPAASSHPLPRSSLNPEKMGLGMTLAQLEAAAEAGLATAVGEVAGEPGRGKGGDGSSGDEAPAGLAEVARSWAAAGAASAARWGEPMVEAALLTEAPEWLAPLLPPVSLWTPGPLSAGPLRLMFANPRRAELANLAGEVYEADYLPAAHQRTEVRPARRLLPAPELQLGWRAHVRAAGAGPANWSTELAWRAALALAALAVNDGRATIEDAAGLIAAEAGLAHEQALLQAITVAYRPLPALAFFAGWSAVEQALERSTPYELLAAGPLPAVAIAMRA